MAVVVVTAVLFQVVPIGFIGALVVAGGMVVGYPSNMVNRLKNLPEPRRKAVDEFLAERSAVKKKETERFREELPSAQVVTFTNAEHACFIDREDDVLREMRLFLAK